MVKVETRKVNEDGTITGLAPGREVLVVTRPDLEGSRVSKVLERPRAMLADLGRFAREHADLTVGQVRQFTDRHGNPADRVRAYASKLSPEEFKARAKELETFVHARFNDVTREVEQRYVQLEGEIDDAVERIFGRASPVGEPEEAAAVGETPSAGAPVAAAPEPVAAKAGGAKKPRAKKAKQD
ncbi:MAG TPA: hypothetical protein VM889_01785 [Candidatus Thermoplasmatota archaeon]|nr:hypothetical protein [Candidatus Thermoplasmatota archaeon]